MSSTSTSLRSPSDSSFGSAISPSWSTRSWPSSASSAVGSRAAARQPTAQESEEGQDRVDQDGELALPADESLEDLDGVELGAEDDEAEPVGADADADIIED